MPWTCRRDGATDPWQLSRVEVALGHWVAVSRELFEEVGILLCVTDAGDAD